MKTNFYLPLHTMRSAFFKLILAFYVLLTMSCSRPVADFTYNLAQNTIPARVNFENKSQKSDEFEWALNKKIISNDKTAQIYFTQSGRQQITLTAIKGKKKTSITKEIILFAPQECLVLLSTSEGDILLKLYSNTLIHQENFIKLLEEGFYKGILFHRVIEGFMIQAGDPQSKNAAPSQRLGAGDLSYTLPKEINKENFHVKGALAAARMGDQANPERRSSASQFYIVHGEPVSENQLLQTEYKYSFTYPKAVREKYLAIGGAPQLDMNYTVFGEVVEGLDIVDKIAVSKTDQSNRPTANITILDFLVLK